MPVEKPIGDRVYIDTRCDSYVWRGRVAGKPKRVVIRHPQTNAVATTSNMTKSEAKQIGRALSNEAETLTGRFSDVSSNGGVTVRDAWTAYMKGDAGKQKSAPEKRSQWRNHIEPAIGDKIISEVTRMDCAQIVTDVLKVAQAKGQHGNAAVNLQKNMKAFFNWCCDTTGYALTGLEASPMAAMKKKPLNMKLTKRPSRALDDRELVWFFKALDQFMHGPCRKGAREQRIRSGQATEFLLRAPSCRREDAFCSLWRHRQGDTLFLPHTKATGGHTTGYALLLPMTPTMVALIGDRPADVEDDALIWGAGMRWLADALTRIRELMTEIARREGFNGNFTFEFFDKGKKERNHHYFTLHDFRDTGKRVLKLAQRDDGLKLFDAEVREAMLNHRTQGIAAVYDYELEAADYMLRERTIAGEWLNRYYDDLKAKALPDVSSAFREAA